MESGVVPDITYTYAPALWNQNGYAMEVQALYDEIGKSGGGWLDLADGNSKIADGTRINVPMNNEPWFVHLAPGQLRGSRREAADHHIRPDDGRLQEGQQARQNFYRLRWADDRGRLDRQRPAVDVDVRRAASSIRKAIATINTPQNIAGLTAYTDLFKNKMMPPGVVSQQVVGQQ